MVHVLKKRIYTPLYSLFCYVFAFYFLNFGFFKASRERGLDNSLADIRQG